MPKQYIISDSGTRGIPIEVEKPNKENYCHAVGLGYYTRFRFDDYEKDLEAYNAALEEGKKHAIPIVGAHNYKDGEVVDADKFRLSWYNFGGFDKSDDYGDALILHTQESAEYEKACPKCGRIGGKHFAVCDYKEPPIPHTDHRGEEDWKAKIAAAEMKYKLGWKGRMHIFLGYHFPDMLFSKRRDIINTISPPESREESEKDAEAIAFKYAGYRKQYREKWNHEPTPHAIAAWFIENFTLARNP